VSEAIERMLDRARGLNGEDAQNLYLEILRRAPDNLMALSALGILAYDSGHRAAARTLYEQAVRHHPHAPSARINLGNLLFEAGAVDGARAQFEAALVCDGASRAAHRGLAQCLTALGLPAQAHWRKSFDGQALDVRRYDGPGRGVAVLLLVSAEGGNIPLDWVLDPHVFAVTALYAEFYDPALPLPPHDVLFNAIGDADLCTEALVRAEAVAARSHAPIVNPPQAVRMTGRAENARRLGALPGIVAPAIRTISRTQPPGDLDFPLLLRAPGFHTGQHFVRVEWAQDLPSAIAALPGAQLLAIQYLDARGPDGLARKYRVMLIGGKIFPVHLAVAADWKVHYFTADMETNAAHRAEEKRFLENMEAVLGPRAIQALHAIADRLGLNYVGVDFALASDGALLLFEANATMVLNPPGPDPLWDYRRAPIACALEAAKEMVSKAAAAR
jgi:tetratricopeptide (TPR) repeat protein